MNLQELQVLSNQLCELSLRAKKINYTNKIPSLPKNPTAATMIGFRKRLGNWTTILKHLETERLHEIISREPALKNFFNN